MKISVVGSGYVGLVTGACLAKLGNEVTLIDTDNDRVEAINNKVSPVYEQGLNEILSQVHIEASSDYQRIIGSDMICICVGTPSNEDGSIFLEDIVDATRRIAQMLTRQNDYCLVAVKSTLAPGTTEELVIPILESSGKKAGKDFGVCMSPEFLKEGAAIHDFMNPARVIMGEDDQRSGDMLLNLY